jgi:glycosyltransferase involved in cell wall biosynthesis
VSERLRIAFVADAYREGLGGGVVTARRFVELLRKDHDVVVVTVGADEPGLVGLRGFELPLRAMKAMRWRFAVPDAPRLSSAFEGVDIVHLQHPFWLAFGALAAARRADVPVVAAFHVQPENLLYNVGLRSAPRLRGLLYRLWVRHLYDRADAVVCPSPLARQRLLEHGLRRPCHVVSNGVPSWFQRRAPSPGDEAGDCFTILMVGRLAPEKRHDVVMDAVARCRHRERIQLVVAGSGPLEVEVRRRGATLPRPARIAWVHEDALLDLYSRAQLFVHASEVELEGMAVLEAMSCGLPTLVADAPESAAAGFAQHPAFLFRAGDPDDLAARIDHWVEHREELAAWGEAQRRSASAHSLEESVTRLVQVYLETIARA